MSSRRLLVLLRHLPDDSPFKKAINDDWPFSDQLTTGVWNEIKALRGDIWAYLGHERLTYIPVLSPSAERDLEEKRAKIRTAHDDISALLRG